MKRIIDISDDTFNILKNMIEADCVDPYSLADIIVNKSIPYEEKSSDENVQTQSLISRYQNDFVSSQTEVVKAGEPLPNSDEINKALEKGEMYKRGFDDAMRTFKRPQGEWLWLCDSPDPKYKWSCNKCGRGVKEQENFCPNCGVEMKGEENEV